MAAELARLGHPMLAALLTVGLSAPVQAETQPEADSKPALEAPLVEELELMKEEESVSIAVRHEQPISMAPADVYVITDEDIRRSGDIDLPTILRRIPGMEVMQMTGAEFNVSIRGDNQTLANKLLVLVDGRSIYLDQEGVVFWKAIPVTLPEIKRIEVIKGPSSALYGFNAFDGIVNIITKSPEEMRGTTLQFGGGTFGTISSSAIHAQSFGKFGLRLSAGHDQTNQWRDRDALAFRSNKFNVDGSYALPGESRLILSGGLVDVNRYDGPLTSSVLTPTTFTDGYARAGYERRNFFVRSYWRGWTSTSQVMANPALDNILTVTDQSGSSTAHFAANTYDVEAQHAVEFGSTNRLTYGSNYRHNTVSYNFLSQYSIENRLGFYIQDEWKTTESLTAVAGVRYDLDSFIKPTVSPRVALIYKITSDHTIRATLSVGYRPPTATERYNNSVAVTTLQTGLPLPLPPTVSATAVALGAKGLSPEEIVSYDVGYQGWLLRHRLRIRADLFFNHLSNLIVESVPLGATATFANGGVADIYGGEAGAEFQATHWLSGFTNFAYEEIGQTLTGEARRGAPRFKVNAGLRGDWENGLSGEAAFYHVGSATYPISPAFNTFAAPIPTPLFTIPPQIPTSSVPNERVGSYNLLNLRGAYKFWRQKAEAGYLREAEVGVSAFNALNDKHKENPIGDTIGSRVMGWLTVRF